MRIGEASKASGVPERMARHYEKLGLISPALRTAGGYRDYTAADVARLSFIARARKVGVSLDDIAELFAAEGAARRHLIEHWLALLEDKASDVVALKEHLAELATDRTALHPRELDQTDLQALCRSEAPETARELDGLVD